MKTMAQCQICGKKSIFGRNVSHSARKTSRKFKPNLQKITFYQGEVKKTMILCAKCIKRIKKKKGFSKQKPKK